MRTLLKVLAVIVIVIIVILVGATIFVKSYFTSDRLKAMVIPKIEDATGRKAEISSINISIFKGVVVNGIALKEPDGKTDFVRANKFVLSYEFWPLLHKQLVINKIELDSPYVVVVRQKNGKYNFSDIEERMKANKPVKPEAAPPQPKKAFPIAIVANSIVIKNAKAQFTDQLKEMPNIGAAADARFRLAQNQTPSGPGYAVSGVLDIKSLKAVLGGLQTDTAGKININNDIKMALNTIVGNDKIALTGDVANYMTAPSATLNVQAATLDLDRIMTAMGSMKKAPPSKAAPRKAAAAPPSKFKAKGKITVGSATYKGITFKDFLAVFRMAGGQFSLNPISAGFQQGTKANIAGTFKAVMSVAMANPKKTLSGHGQANLTQVQIKKSAITSQIATLLQMPELASPTFGTSQLNFTAVAGVINFNGSMLSQNLEINPLAGKLALANNAIGATFTLNLSPAASAKLPGGRYKSFFKDQRGWTVLPFIVKGTADKPSVTINQAALQKQAGKRIGQELKKRFLPGGGNQNAPLPGMLKKLFH